MKLIGDLFLILKEDERESGFVAHLFLNPEHLVYKGHFPGQPVTPGVIQMQIVHELLERHLKKKLKLISMPQSKFLSILNPEKSQEVKFVIDLKMKEGCLSVNASGMNNDTIFFKLRATYQMIN